MIKDDEDVDEEFNNLLKKKEQESKILSKSGSPVKQEGALDFEDEEEIEEYDEEEEEHSDQKPKKSNYSEEELDEDDARLKIIGNKISDTLASASDPQKALFFSVLMEWLCNSISTAQGVFEKERLSKFDEQ